MKKKIISALLALSIMFSGMAMPVFAEDYSVDYMALMIKCAQDGSQAAMELGKGYEMTRNQKIREMGLGYQVSNFFVSSNPEEILASIDYYRQNGMMPGGTPEVSIDYSINYMSMILNTLQIGTPEALAAAKGYEITRNQKIEDLGMAYGKTRFFELTDVEQIRLGIDMYRQFGVVADNPVKYYTDDDITMIAKVIYREARGIASDTEKACIAWTILNRVDAGSKAGYRDTIEAVVTQPYQFAYVYNTPVWSNLRDLAADVLWRWNAEKNGATAVGRVLPSNYYNYYGDGKHNYFTPRYRSGAAWNYSLTTPYNS